jgi:hypothetical protein
MTSEQCSLISERTGSEPITVVCSGDGEALKSVCPLTAQMALDADLIDHRLTWIHCSIEFARQVPVSLVDGQNRLPHVLDLPGV